MPRVLIVTTSHGELGASGERTGLWLEELAAPYWVFRDAGFDVEVASMAGGAIPIDPRSQEGDEATKPDNARFLGDRRAAETLKQSKALAQVADGDYDVLFLPGGHGTMWDMPANATLARAVGRAYDHGRIVAAVCHGPAGLVGAKRSDGKPVVAARKVSAFTNAEEANVGLGDTVPFLLESRLRELGAIFEASPPFRPHVVRDGNLVTGQNPQSSQAVAQAAVEAAREPRAGEDRRMETSGPR